MMSDRDFSRTVSLKCPTCGGHQFEFGEDEGPIRCDSCSRVFGTKEELISGNGDVIDAEVELMIDDVKADLDQKFAKIFKNFR